jgi:hypothetical protein
MGIQNMGLSRRSLELLAMQRLPFGGSFAFKMTDLGSWYLLLDIFWIGLGIEH